MYFDGNSNSSLSVENRLYLSFGDMNLQNIDLAWCVMFNKQLAEDNSLPNMYELVENGTWDFDTFSTLARNNSRDLNGDGEITKDDSFGLVTPYDRTAFAFLYGADESYEPSQNIIEANDKIIELVGGADTLVDEAPAVTSDDTSSDVVWQGDGSGNYDYNDYSSDYSDDYSDDYSSDYSDNDYSDDGFEDGSEY